MATVRSSTQETIRVEGLRELLRGLKALDVALVDEVKRANFDAATVVVDDARSKADRLGSTARHVAPSLKASKAAANAAVTLGGSAFPMAFGAEFGAKRFHQFPPWRGNQWEPSGEEGVGYFLHPAVRDKVGDIEEAYLKRIDEIAAQAFPD